MIIDKIIIKYGKFILVFGIIAQCFLRYKGVEHFPIYHYGMFSEKIEIQSIKGIVIQSGNTYSSLKDHVKLNLNISEQQLLNADSVSLKMKMIEHFFLQPGLVKHRLYYVTIDKNKQLNYQPFSRQSHF